MHKVALTDLHRVAFANGRKRACIMRRKAHEMLQLNDVRSLYIFLYRVAVVVGVSDSLYVATQQNGDVIAFLSLLFYCIVLAELLEAELRLTDNLHEVVACETLEQWYLAKLVVEIQHGEF